MQHVIANRTRRTFLWCLIAGVIRATPGYTKTTVCVVTMTLLSLAINSRCAEFHGQRLYEGIQVICWIFDTRNFSLLVNVTERRAGYVWEQARHSTGFHQNFMTKVFARTFVAFVTIISLLIWRREFLPDTAHWYLEFVQCRYKSCLLF